MQTPSSSKTSIIPEQWIQDVNLGENIGLPAVSHEICKVVLPAVETQIKSVLQLATKFQRRGKGLNLTVEDLNLAFECTGIEHVYGYPGSLQMKNSLSSGGSLILEDSKLKLEEYINTPLPRCPLLPDLSLHWLAVHGTQPRVAENPSVVAEETDNQPLSLPQEMQFFYSRLTGVLLSEDSSALTAAYCALQTDSGLDSLLPYLCRFIYTQVKANTRNLPLLRNLIRALRALLENPSLQLDVYLHQLMPALFTCVVGVRLSCNPEEDHWALRKTAACVVAFVCRKHSGGFPDLLPRACKTYLTALSADKPLSTAYGGLIGLMCLGHHVVRTLLLPIIAEVSERANLFAGSERDVVLTQSKILSSVQSQEKVEAGNSGESGASSLKVNSGKIRVKSTSSDGRLEPKSNSNFSLIKSKSSKGGPKNKIRHRGSGDDSEMERRLCLTQADKQADRDRGKVKDVDMVVDPRRSYDIERCRELIKQILGEYMTTSMKSYGPDPGLDLDLRDDPWQRKGKGDGLSLSDQREKRRRIRAATGRVISQLDLAEPLVPYFASASRELNYARLFL